MGDDAFFAGLNKSRWRRRRRPDRVWGNVLGRGQLDRGVLRRSARGGPGQQANARSLVGALVKAYFTAFTSGAEFVDLDTGSGRDQRARQVARLRRRRDVPRRAGAVARLPRPGRGVLRPRGAEDHQARRVRIDARAIPLVSFVARQLDLRRYFVESGGGAGAEQDALDAAFRHQEGRFRTIVLGDDNLPYVAEKRLLKPVDDEAKAILDDAFARLDRTPAGLGRAARRRQHRRAAAGADQAAFRRTYPFSPALVSTLRTLASAMQRDRTALKVMQQLLVDQRDHLTVADVIPVGDAFDLVVHGNQAITAEMQGRFRNAKELYDDKLRPLLLREHKLSDDDARDAAAGDTRSAPTTGSVKTLVLSAVAPEVPALKELTAGRLAALNHGSIVSPLPGQEASIVLSKLKRWHAEIPEIHITSDAAQPGHPAEDLRGRLRVGRREGQGRGQRRAPPQPAQGARLGGLRPRPRSTTTSPASAARPASGADRGVRSRSSSATFATTPGSPRRSFKAGPDTWRFVVDYPFDDQGHSVREDDKRVDDLAQRGARHQHRRVAAALPLRRATQRTGTTRHP